MLHCLVFKEQLCLFRIVCFSFLTTSIILSQPVQFVKRFLKFLFCLNSKLFTFRCLPFKASHLSAPVSLAATCIILHASPLLVNTFFEKMIKEDEQLWDEQLLVFFGKESFILERNGGSGIHFTSCREALGDIGFPYRQLHCNRAI